MRIRKERLNENSRVYNRRFNKRLNESLYDDDDESGYYNDSYYVQIEKDLNKFGYTMNGLYFGVLTPYVMFKRSHNYFTLGYTPDRQEIEQEAKDAKWEDFDNIEVYTEGEIRPIEYNRHFKFDVSIYGLRMDKDKYKDKLFRYPDPDMFEDFAKSLRNAQSAQKVIDNIDWLKFPVFTYLDELPSKNDPMPNKVLADYIEKEKRRYKLSMNRNSNV